LDDFSNAAALVSCYSFIFVAAVIFLGLSGISSVVFSIVPLKGIEPMM